MSVGAQDADTIDVAPVIAQKADGLGGVADVDALGATYVELLVGQALACAYGLDQQAAPEAELAGGVILEGLAPVGEDEADALGVEPLHGGERLADQNLGQLRVAVALGDAHHVVVELVLGVAADVDRFLLGGRHVGDDGLDVFEAVEGEADDAAGEVGVTAAEVLGRLFDDQHRGTALASGDGGGQGGIAGADHDNVIGVGQDTPRIVQVYRLFYRRGPIERRLGKCLFAIHWAKLRT